MIPTAKRRGNMLCIAKYIHDVQGISCFQDGGIDSKIRLGTSRKGEGKENLNYTQCRTDRYSPIKQPQTSPYKPNPNYDQLPNRRNNQYQDIPFTDRITTSREDSARKQEKYSNYNHNRNIYKSRQPPCQPVNCEPEIEIYQEYETVCPPISRPLDSSRISRPASPSIGASANVRSSVSYNCTPKKVCNLEPAELVEKTQYLKQRLEKLNKMTPKAYKKQPHQIPQTPQKILLWEIKQPKQTKQLRDLRSQLQLRQLQCQALPSPRSRQSQIVKHNKYCDQILPLETIYDAEEHRNREATEQDEGLEQINRLSKKISDRLSKIITRHAN